MNVSQVGRVIIPVNDQQKAVDFYCGTLGFEKRVDVPMGGDYRWIEVGPKGGTTTIAVVNPPQGESAGGRETGITLDTTDIDADYAELKAKGVDVDAELMGGDGTVPLLFSFRDHDANQLMVVQAR